MNDYENLWNKYMIDKFQMVYYTTREEAKEDIRELPDMEPITETDTIRATYDKVAGVTYVEPYCLKCSKFLVKFFRNRLTKEAGKCYDDLSYHELNWEAIIIERLPSKKLLVAGPMLAMYYLIDENKVDSYLEYLGESYNEIAQYGRSY